MTSRHYRDPTPGSGPFNSLCWCQLTYVPVTPEMVKAGLTGSCGKKKCHG